MSFNNSLNNGVNEAITDNYEGLSPGRCPAGKQRGPSRHQITARKKWTKEENKTSISRYLKALKESKRGYRKQMDNIWNKMGMFEIEEQHLECQVCSIFRNSRFTEIEIQQLCREIEKVEMAPERVDTVLEMSYGGSNDTKTVREQGCDLDNYPGSTPEDCIKNPIHQRLIEIMHERAKGDIPTLHSRDINLVTKHVNEVNEMLKCIPVKNLSHLKYVKRAGALLVCEKVDVKTDYTINKKEPFCKQGIEKDIAISRKNLSRIAIGIVSREDGQPS